MDIVGQSVAQLPEIVIAGRNYLRKIAHLCCELKSFCKKEQKDNDCDAICIGITSLILMAMLKNLAFLQKLLKDWVRVLGRQELFPGLVTTNVALNKEEPPQAAKSQIG